MNSTILSRFGKLCNGVPRIVFLVAIGIQAAACVALAVPDRTNEIPKHIATFSAALDTLRKEHHIPGLAAAIVSDGALAWSEGYGLSHFDAGDGDAHREVTPDTPFWIASVTKPFIGLLFLQLAEEGAIDLDERINSMPGWADFCDWLANSGLTFGEDLRCDAPITLRNVLNHTVNGEPGSAFLYNPMMYSRLSRYLEHVHGNPISDAERGQNVMARLVEEKILGPADMTSTMSSQWDATKASVFFDMASGYGYVDGRYVRRMRPERHLAGGAGIVSTVGDLAKFDIALGEGRLAPDSVMERLFRSPVAPGGKALPYAFGWYVQEYRGERLIWHAGWDEEAGFSALYLKVPDRDLTLILLANGEGLYWGNPLDGAAVEQSPFARLFLDRVAVR